MKIKDILFRKMTILYFTILFILGTSFGILLFDYYTTRCEIENNLSTNDRVMVLSKTQLKEIPEAYTFKEVKKVGLFYYVIDETLTGNECIISNIRDTEIGKEFENEGVKCTIKTYSKISKPVLEVSVSKDFYDSLKTEMYAYVTSPKSIKDMRKMQKKYFDAYTLIVLGFQDFEIAYSNLISKSIVLASVVVIIALLIVVVFMNTRGYAINNTKKSRSKKKKVETTTKTIVGVTLITTVVPLVLSFLFDYFYLIGLLIYN